MTALIARPPLQLLSMSAIQSGSRRHSARLQHKEDSTGTNGTTNAASTTVALSTRVQTSATNTKKRKAYDEEDDGFVFSRVKKKKPRQSVNASAAEPPVLPTVLEIEKKQVGPEGKKPAKPAKRDAPVDQSPVDDQDEAAQTVPKKRRNRMSFSTPGVKQTKEQQPIRRSKRLSTEVENNQASPPAKDVPDLRPPKIRKEKNEKHKPPAQKEPTPVPEPAKRATTPAPSTDDESHSSTKIALPFADTPVITRNKAMREGKSGKSERRSSLGLRGRRASSLIDSGTSNALPHAEVETQDFYKHIEGDLIEPRRMKQLLTWCATRAMHSKPQGTGFEEASARSAARVIEEELLKDLANKSELSDWFGREDAPAPIMPLPQRPNPKNATNTEKIAELEEQIRSLRIEKERLESLRRPPAISVAPAFEEDLEADIDPDLLSESDAKILAALRTSSTSVSDLSSRVNKITTTLGPAIDTFADGVHKINQYRVGADDIASQVLSICAEKLSEREKAGRRKALDIEEDRSPGRDLSSVLRGLSKTDR